MLSFKLKNNELVASSTDFSVQIVDETQLSEHITNSKLPVIINEMKNFNNSTNINFYQKIIYGSFLLTRDTFKTTSTIFFIYQNDVLTFFTKDSQMGSIIDILNKEMLQHEVNFKNSIDLTLLFAYMILNDLAKFSLKTQNQIDKIENELINENMHKKFNHKLLALRKQVTKLRKQVTYINNYIELYLYYHSNNENNPYASLLQRRVVRLQNDIKDMSEHTIQIKELYQNQLDVSLNDTMNLFTVISAIFLPLTLITSWYGMNFGLPELSWKYGYLIPAILCLFALFLIIYLVKKYRFLRKED